MNLEKLCKNHYKLIRHLVEHDYNKSYIDSFRSALTCIFKNSGEKGWTCYEDVYRYFECVYKPNRYKQYQSILTGIRDFDLYDKYPGGRRSSFQYGSEERQLCSDFNLLIEYYKSAESDRGYLKTKTIERNVSCAKSFFMALQAIGITEICDITEKTVLSVFLSVDGELLKGETYSNAVKNVLVRCSELYQTEPIIALIPVAKKYRKNIQYLTQEETQKIRTALSSSKSNLTLRDKAIGTLAYYTGLRASDISGLNLDSVDLENDKIHIVQQKTEVPLDIPLSAVVGNAILDYVTCERPKSANPAIFLTKCHLRLSSKAMYSLSDRIMKAAGIRQGKNQRKGLHIFRHNLATTLLGNGIPQPVISSALGQVDPLSVETYLSSDFVNLKSCALSIDDFPIAKGVPA